MTSTNKYTQTVPPISKYTYTVTSTNKYTQTVPPISKYTYTVTSTNKYTQTVPPISKYTYTVTSTNKYTHIVTSISKYTHTDGSVSFGGRKHQLHLCRAVRPYHKCPGYDIKPSDVEVPALEIWVMWSTPSLNLLPDSLA